MSDSQLAKQQNFEEEIIYPESDGKPMADNTKQFDWITNIVHNLRTRFRNEPNVFIAGDLLWYPVKGDNKTRRAPDVMVAFGLPKHHRGSYQQWLEDNIAPQVVFEIRSPGNKDTDMEDKLQFYQDYKVEEYYMYDPDRSQLKGWLRGGNQLNSIVPMNDWKSPRLGVHFELKNQELHLYHPDGSHFTSHQEETQARLAETKRADAEAKRADEEAQARLAADAEVARLKQLLKQQGISLNG